jgi:hypothetical protein
LTRLGIPLNERKCVECGATTTRIEQHHGKPYQRWHNIDGKCHCWRCWKRLIQYHRYDKKYDREVRQKKRVTFQGKRIRLRFKPRNGYCSWCSNNIYDGTAGRTSKHHYFYIPIMVWACTEEICNTCHINETRRIRNQKRLE